MSNERDSYLEIAVIGAGGKMGMRVSANLEATVHQVFYVEPSQSGRERVEAAGRPLTDAVEAAKQSDVVILAVPDVVLGKVSEELVPAMKPGSILFTLDPAAAYAGLLAERDDVHQVCAHPCHPSVFLQRTTPEEYADTFGGEAAAQDVVAALDTDDEVIRGIAETVIRTMYAPVLDVHWVTVKQLAILEPTLVETVTCMISGLLAEALDETINGAGVPEAAAKAMLYGHVQIALTNSLRGSNPFSDACLVAMDYGREAVIKDDWKRIFNDDELDTVIGRMLQVGKAAQG